MKSFREWLGDRLRNEMMGSVGSIVSCKDLKNPNFQVQGAASNMKCGKKKEKMLKMRFN